LRPPNTHYIRKFNDRAKSVTGTGRQVMENEEIRGLQAELLDVLCYTNDLENQIEQLQQKLKDSEVVSVELQGGNF